MVLLVSGRKQRTGGQKQFPGKYSLTVSYAAGKVNKDKPCGQHFLIFHKNKGKGKNLTLPAQQETQLYSFRTA